LLEVDAFLAHAVGQPVMLIETDPGRERQIRAHAHEHAAPAPVVDIEVVLHDPAVGDLQVPAVRLLVADRRHDPRRLSGFEDDDDLIRLGTLEVGFDKFVATTLRRLDDRSLPSVGLLLHPALELFSGGAQHIAADRIDLPVAVEEANHPLGLLERLDQAVEQDPVEAAIAEADAVLVVLVKGVHHRLLSSRAGRLAPRQIRLHPPISKGYQGRGPWLVRSTGRRVHSSQDSSPELGGSSTFAASASYYVLVELLF
jgi:hypothetical protein